MAQQVQQKAADGDEEKEVFNPVLRDIVKTPKTYRFPLYSCYQSIVQEHLMKDKEITHVEGTYHHPMMTHLNQFLDYLESSVTQAANDAVAKALASNDEKSEIDINNVNFFDAPLHYKWAKSYHDEHKNPAALLFMEAHTHVETLKTAKETADSVDKMRFQPLNLHQTFCDHDARWAECAAALAKYMYCSTVDNLHYKTYKDKKGFTDFQFKIPNKRLRIGILGDWGGGNRLAKQTLNGLVSKKPDIVIHLGDVYYSGTDKEFNAFYVDLFNKAREESKQKFVVFSVPGNHDYYAGGEPFFKAVQKVNESQYVPDWFAELNKDKQQTSSFWGLSNDKFYICGMDTGWDSGNAVKQKECARYPQLPKGEIEYHIKHWTDAAAQGKSILVNSHHPLFSAFEPVGCQVSGGFLGIGAKHKDIYVNSRLEKAMKGHLKDFTFWFWGHEHNFAVYDEYLELKRGRLVGNGCFPEIESEYHPYKVRNNKVPLTQVKGEPIQVGTSQLTYKDLLMNDTSKTETVYNCGFAYIDLNLDGSCDAYYYEIQQKDPQNPNEVWKESVKYTK